MDFIINFVFLILNYICTINIIFISILVIILYHVLMIFIRDKKYAKPFKMLKEPNNITLEDLKEIPLVNIIIPAWNEGEIFRQCLNSITKLKYPKLKVIVNAGGSEETINIANSFKKFNNFKIIYQEGGGKIKALNECLPYAFEGILYLVDADVYFTDEILIRLLYPLTNLDEKVTVAGHRPLKYQENKDFVKYLYIKNNLSFRRVIKRYGKRNISGANSCLRYEVIEILGRFSEDRLWPEDVSRGFDIVSKGFRIFHLIDSKSLIYSHVSDTFKVFFEQRVRWIENKLKYASQVKNRIEILKFFCLFLFSLSILIFPFMLFIHFGLFLIGIYFLLSIYLKIVRRIIFFKKTRPKFFKKFKIWFYFKIIFYIYLEAITNIYTLIDYIFFRRKFKKRRNL